MYIIGISAFYHDSAAVIIYEGKIIAAAQEERFTRKKHDESFPKNALFYCLFEASKHFHECRDVKNKDEISEPLFQETNFSIKHISHIVFYDKPLLKFERLIESSIASAPSGFLQFTKMMPVWLKDKLFVKSIIKKEILAIMRAFFEINKTNSVEIKSAHLPKILFSEHHQSHASSAFFPSPYTTAAVLCLDGVGEWVTSSGWLGNQNKLENLWEIYFPHSLGLLYSAFTYYSGFKVNSGEYKLMGLAPYGTPNFVSTIKKYLIDIKPDGSYRLNMDYFGFLDDLSMINQKFEKLFGGPARMPESQITQKDMDLAASIQLVTEEVLLNLAKSLFIESNDSKSAFGIKKDIDSLCLSGGVALNCVANGKILTQGPFKNIWIQPASGDAGGALGAALSAFHQYLNHSRKDEKSLLKIETEIDDQMSGAKLGPHFTQQEIESSLDNLGALYSSFDDAKVVELTASFLAQNKVIGWFQDRMEFGPRALGCRSILGNATDPESKKKINMKVKFRESFRPFAPSVMVEKSQDYFDIKCDSPYMLLVADVKKEIRKAEIEDHNKLNGIEKLNISRSTIPAATHVDFSARIQTVTKNQNQKFYLLLKKVHELTGLGLVVNTSFNVRGEPPVCTPKDAYTCFMRTDLDYLIIGNCILAKEQQPEFKNDDDWKTNYTLD